MIIVGLACVHLKYIRAFLARKCAQSSALENSGPGRPSFPFKLVPRIFEQQNEIEMGQDEL